MIAKRRRRHAETGNPVSRVQWHQLLAEAIAGILQRPGRSALTALGTVLGIGSFVAVLGITTTANSQISQRFNALSSTQVSIEQQTDDAFLDVADFPDDAEARIAALKGSAASGIYWTFDSKTRVSSAPPPAGGGASSGTISVMAASPGFWSATHPTLTSGRTFDDFLQDQRVAIVGEGIADQLAIGTLDTQPAIFIDDVPFTVIGVLGGAKRVPDTLLSVTIPAAVASKYWGKPETPSRMIVETDVGAAKRIADQAPLALSASNPAHFKATTAVDARVLRDNVSSDLGVLFLALAGICLFIGAVGIANTTLVAVLERVPEIGLRRSLGALPRHIGTQFLMESTALGAIGGLIGTSFGTLSVLGVAIAKDWTATLAPWTVIVAPVLGAFLGLVAGLYPSLRAARIEPIEAFRR
jgi:putative ABC transport system permease protein